MTRDIYDVCEDSDRAAPDPRDARIAGLEREVRDLQASGADACRNWQRYRIAELEAEVARLRAGLDAAERVMWMAEEYADGVGSHGPERRGYRELTDALSAEVERLTDEGRAS